MLMYYGRLLKIIYRHKTQPVPVKTAFHNSDFITQLFSLLLSITRSLWPSRDHTFQKAFQTLKLKHVSKGVNKWSLQEL